MCDPIVFGTAAAMSSTGVATAATTGLFGSAGVFSLGATLSTASSALSVMGSLSSSSTQQSNYEYQAHMANYNAQIQSNNAIMAERAAVFEADMHDDRLKRLMGTQESRFAKSGVVINQDTPLQVASETAEQGALDRLAILYRGKTQATANRAAATGQNYAAVNARNNAVRAQASGFATAAASGLGLLI